jgi:EAL domain-containing protein (putative c-di-GMP-specific phosphodiesterase class I)/GGDEF domain-containing protein
MSWSIDPLLWAALACVFAAIVLQHRRRTTRLEAFDDALARVRSGETGVRLEPGAWGRDARLVSRFNAALAEIEAGTFDWDHASSEQTAMFESLRKQPAPSAEHDSTFVAVVEIDRFAALRKSVGYRIANRLLAGLAARIPAAIETAEMGRIGRATIEFAFRATSVGDAQLRLLDAIAALEKRLAIEELGFDVTVTIGFAHAGNSSIRDELVDQAAAALTAAQGERVKVGFASEALLVSDVQTDLELMRALPRALAAGELELHYQPKLDARSDCITAAEALIRWTDPNRGLVQTDRFIRIAEESGTIRDLTEWVIARAVNDQLRLAAEGHDLEIYVNISGQLLPSGDFAEAALNLVEPALGKIGFEITETAVIGDPEAALANLRAFEQAGIKIAIDDYGSGLSSLAYLKQLPAHELKIDRMFVSGLTESHRDPLLVRSSIDLAHALEMVVTAEGVDDPMALSLLRVMGCDLLQGYFVSPPLPLAGLLEFLNDAGQMERLLAPPPQASAWPRQKTA